MEEIEEVKQTTATTSTTTTTTQSEKQQPEVKFNGSSTALQVARNIRLDGKNAIVTGGNTGIGKETCRVFCKMGANVFLLSRDQDKGNGARQDILNEIGDTFSKKLHVMICDLSSFQSIRNFVKEWSHFELPLHILVNNAGVMACPRGVTVDGFETHFGVNHLGHFLLTNLLLPYLKLAQNARVVNLSSLAHNFSGIRFDICGKTDVYNEWFGAYKAYGISKTANILFSAEFDSRFKDQGIRCNSVHPGAIGTDLGRHDPMANLFYQLKFLTKSIPQGAATSVYVATAPEVEDIGGKYFSDCTITNPASHATAEADGKQLWDLSLKWVGISE